MSANPYPTIRAAAYRSLAPAMPDWAVGGLTVEQMDNVARGLHPSGRPMATKWGEFCFGCATRGRRDGEDTCFVVEGQDSVVIQANWPACSKWRRGR